MTQHDALESVLGVPGLSRALIEQSPLSTVIFDMAGHVVFNNDATVSLWGVGMSDTPADYSILHDPQLTVLGLLPLVERAFRGETVVMPRLRYDASSLVPGARARWSSGHFYPLRGTDGKLHGVALINVDLSGRARRGGSDCRQPRQIRLSRGDGS